MRDNIPSAGRGNKILPAILIAANLLMLVIGVLAIPPNLPSAAVKESPAPRTEQTALVTPASEKETPPAATERIDAHQFRRTPTQGNAQVGDAIAAAQVQHPPVQQR